VLSDNKKKISAYLNPKLEAEAKKLAKDNQMSLSTLIAFLLNQAVETQKIQLAPSESTEAPVEPPAEAEAELVEDVESVYEEDECDASEHYEGPEDDPNADYYEAMCNAPLYIPGMREQITKRFFPDTAA
jgi:hypothetical protein